MCSIIHISSYPYYKKQSRLKICLRISLNQLSLTFFPWFCPYFTTYWPQLASLPICHRHIFWDVTFLGAQKKCFAVLWTPYHLGIETCMKTLQTNQLHSLGGQKLFLRLWHFSSMTFHPCGTFPSRSLILASLSLQLRIISGTRVSKTNVP